MTVSVEDQIRKLDRGDYHEGFYFCIRCQIAHYKESKNGRRHQKRWGITSKMWDDPEGE